MFSCTFVNHSVLLTQSLHGTDDISYANKNNYVNLFVLYNYVILYL